MCMETLSCFLLVKVSRHHYFISASKELYVLVSFFLFLFLSNFEQ